MLQTKYKTLNASLRTTNTNHQEIVKKLAKKTQKYKTTKESLEQLKEETSELKKSQELSTKKLSENFNKKSIQLEQAQAELALTQNELIALKKIKAEITNAMPSTTPPTSSLPIAPESTTPNPPSTGLQNSRSSSSSLAMQKLLLTIDQKNGQVTLLQATIDSLKESKLNLEDQLVQLMSKNEDLEKLIQQLLESEKEFKSLKSRYVALLELLGERSEKATELTNDIDDMKQLYKQQINMLCTQIEGLTKENQDLKKKFVNK